MSYTVGGSSYLFECSNLYVLKNELVNSKLKYLGEKIGMNKKFEMIAFFDSLNSNTFTYTCSTSELNGYSGNVLTKLNKYVEDHESDNLLSWKIDEESGKLAFNK